MRTGLFGGTFDPVHRGHIESAFAVMGAYALDRIIFIPSKQPVHKDSVGADACDRCAMLALAIHGCNGFELSRIEIDRESPSFSVTTIRDMLSVYPGDDFFFLLGVDAFNGLRSWREYESLIRMVRFIVMARSGAVCDEQLLKLTGACVADNELVDVSSTHVRESLRKGIVPQGMLHPEVERFIREKGLYRS